MTDAPALDPPDLRNLHRIILVDPVKDQNHQMRGVAMKNTSSSIRIERSAWADLPVQSPRHCFAIGDIHGLSSALDVALAEVEAVAAAAAAQGDQPPLLVTLGDYIDRGPDSLGVIDRLIKGVDGVETHHLAGNHEQMFFAGVYGNDGFALMNWLRNGGMPVLEEMGFSTVPCIDEVRSAFGPERYDFIANLKSNLRLDPLLFIHAGLNPFVPLEESLAADWRVMIQHDYEEDHSPFWTRFPFIEHEGAFEDDLFVVHGHTPSKDQGPHPHRLNLDRGSYSTGQIALAELQGSRMRLTTITDDSIRAARRAR